MPNSFFKTALARNTAWMIGGQGLRLVIQAVYFIEIARSLGVRNYGAFVGVVALVGIVYPFASLGSGNLLIKNVSRDKSLFSAYWGRALVFTAFCGAFLLFAVCVLARLVLPPEIPTLLVVSVSAADIFGLNLITVSAQAFQAIERLGWTAAIYVVMTGGRLAGALILIAIRPHPSALLWSYLYFGSTAVIAIVTVVLVCWKIGLPKISWPNARGATHEGFYFAASQTAQTVYNDIDKTMLARLSTLEATGIYGAAYRIIDVSFVPVSALLWSSYPSFFRAGARGISSSLAYARPLLFRALAYAGLVCAGLLLGAGIVPHILGEQYRQTAEALRWLSVLPLLKAVHYFLSDTLTGAGYQSVRTSLQAGVAVFNVLLNLWVIPAYSWRGAAWSSIASDVALVLGVAIAVSVLHSRSRSAVASAVPQAQCGWATGGRNVS
ncbi:MAG TPA: oligosaccharide flippase family protein [Candidatus Acidoferrum sp.]|nr:oligosaccharide flippase family protein [Candidatus Acidoferrum sp.]